MLGQTLQVDFKGNAKERYRCTDSRYISVLSWSVEDGAVELYIVHIFSMRVGSSVGYLSFLDVSAVHLPCTN